MRQLGWALVQSDGCSYKKRTFGHRETPEMGVQEEGPCEEEGLCEVARGGHLQTKARGFGRSPSCKVQGAP